MPKDIFPQYNIFTYLGEISYIHPDHSYFPFLQVCPPTLAYFPYKTKRKKKSHVEFVLPIKSSAHGQTSNSQPLKDKCVPLRSTLEAINFEKLHFSFFITIFKAIFNGFLSGLLLSFGGGKVVIEAFNVSHSQLWISRPCADTNNCLNFVIAATLSEPMAFCNLVF